MGYHGGAAIHVSQGLSEQHGKLTISANKNRREDSYTFSSNTRCIFKLFQDFTSVSNYVFKYTYFTILYQMLFVLVLKSIVL